MAGVGKMTTTEVAPSIDSIISSLISDNFYEYGRIIPLVNDVSQFAVKGMNQVSFPCLDELDHELQSFPMTTPGPLGGPDAITCQQLQVSMDVLPIDKKCVLGISYDPCDLYQSVLNWEQVFEQKVAQTLVQGVELELIQDLLAVDAANAINAATAGVLSEGDLLCLVERLDLKGIPRENRVFVVNPTDYKRMMQLSCFLKANESGSDQALRNGQIGRVFGAPVIMSRLVTAGTILYFHRDHVRYARQGETSILRADEPKLGCKVMSFTAKFGHTVIKGGCRGATLTI